MIFKLKRKRDPVESKQLKNINKRLTKVEGRMKYIETELEVLQRGS